MGRSSLEDLFVLIMTDGKPAPDSGVGFLIIDTGDKEPVDVRGLVWHVAGLGITNTKVNGRVTIKRIPVS